MRYQLLGEICVTSGSRLYRARSLGSDKASAVLKLPSADDAAGQSRFRREYAALHALDIPGVVKPLALAEDAGRLMMVLKQFQGESLEDALRRRRFALPDCLRLASQLAHILSGLHGAHLIHQDLRPANLLVTAGDAHLALLDVSLATSDTQQLVGSGEGLARDWTYVSPEQTGRMNRPVDYRTDFYSLGVLLYRMLTGRLPFDAEDALAWAHCHIARVPRPPSDVDADIPPVVSDIVMKLLAKLPEDRYQSARGLAFDLERCLEQWQTSGGITTFPLASQDIADRFRIPQKLYGRETAKAELLAAFSKVTGSGQVMLVNVAGAAGIGKSMLVHELQKPVAEQHGYFISGKFDQHQRDIPYATLVQAFGGLVQQLLSESETRIHAWRERIRSAVGINGRLIVDLLPRLELIIGRQPDVPSLAPSEARNRFHLVFRRFIGIFAQPDHPLVIFLDDLQWADAASLGLIGELLLHTEMCHLLLVGAYRDNELEPTHPLLLMLDEARRQGAVLRHIALGPMSHHDLARLIGETLHCAPDRAASLAELIQQKTGGNPFFATQFLAELNEQRLIRFDPAHGAWRWNIERIRTRGFTDNVVDLMLEKLMRLPGSTQQALKHIACLGSVGELSLIAASLGESETRAEEELRDAVRAGLVSRMDGGYVFLHNRIQEAAYSLIPAAERAALHLRIARHMRSRLAPEPAAEQIFDLAGQFNRALPAMTDAAERSSLVELNMRAGKKARQAIAYAAARAYFAQAAALVESDGWDARYPQTFQLYLAFAEAEYLIGDFRHADDLTNMLLEHARSDLDRVRACQLKMTMYQVAGDFAQTLEVAIKAMALLGMAVPGDDMMAQAADAEWRAVRANLAGRRIADIAAEPLLEDPATGMLINLLVDVAIPAYRLHPALYRLLAAKAVNLSLRHGNHPASAYAYNRHAVRTLSETDDITSAAQFSEMSIRLNERFGDASLKGRLLANHASYIVPWRMHISNALPLLDEAYQACLDVGDISFAGIVAEQIGWHRIERGEPLGEVKNGFDKFFAFAEQARSPSIYAACWLQRQLVAHLMGETESSFDIENFDETAKALPRTKWGPGFSHYELMKLIADFMDGRHAAARAAAQKVAESADKLRNLAFEPLYLLFHALTLSALHIRASPDEQREMLRTLDGLVARLRFRADHCPENWRSQYALVAAELARIQGHELEAERLYEEAIRSAGDNGFVNHQALACELAAEFYRGRGFDAIADLYLRQARDCYQRWGAGRKLQQIDRRHPLVAPRQAPVGPADEGQLDLLSMAKATQAISGHIVLDELVDTLMRIAIESAGAQSGALVLTGKDGLTLAAEAASDGQAVRVNLDHGQGITSAALPETILNYVRRSMEQVLIGDAHQPHPFAGDPYFAQRQPKSLLCLPIMRQSGLVGLLYLENELVTYAFTRDRMKVLELLATQAAISLENAQLYADLRRENRERQRAQEMLREREARIRRLVESNIIGVFFWRIEGEVYEANQAVLGLLGYGEDDLRRGGIRWQAMLTADFKDLHMRAQQELLRSGVTPSYECVLRRRDGSRVAVFLGAASFGGRHDEGVAFVLDLTEQKRVEEALRRAQDELETRVAERTRELTQSNERLAREIAERQHAEGALAERSADLARSNAELEQFAYVASHDLQEPLRMVGSYMQLLKKRYQDKLDSDAQEFIEYAVDGAKRMQGLIDDLLSYSRVGTKAKPFAPVELSAALQRALESLKAAIKESGAEIRVGPLPRVMGDAGQLAQLFQNLVGNAIKFRRSEVAPRVEVEAEEAEGTDAGWRISVRDNGIGVAPEYFERIFVMFQRLHTRREYPGTGIGLAICKKIVERHGGHIWIETGNGGGCQFHFTLPSDAGHDGAQEGRI